MVSATCFSSRRKKELNLVLTKYLKYYDLLNFLSVALPQEKYKEINDTEWNERLERDFLYYYRSRKNVAYVQLHSTYQDKIFSKEITLKDRYITCSYYQTRIKNILSYNSIDDIVTFLKNRFLDDKDKEIIDVFMKYRSLRNKIRDLYIILLLIIQHISLVAKQQKIKKFENFSIIFK